MATVEQVQSITLIANADLKTNQFHFVKLVDASGTARIELATDATTEEIVGVLMNKPGEVTNAAGEAGEVAYAGVAKVAAGAAVTAGTNVTVDGTGRAITTTTAGDMVAGRALATASGAGEIIPVLLNTFTIHA
jgi:hypothetical protein